ncbi:MAG: hypothetical protein R2867_03405 [Caldilineaceae bacterium]
MQYLLYVLMANINFLASNPQTTGVPIPVQSARMAMAVLAFGPALFSFLLLQKYFVRGITIGGLKGKNRLQPQRCSFILYLQTPSPTGNAISY